ncbi:MAG TPA: c-type cytochrome [Candidatus Sulfotelmatobacter sp.]|nr:c-type cytochrome [Candidatus Sulfotelmatobacter sp.]
MRRGPRWAVTLALAAVPAVGVFGLCLTRTGQALTPAKAVSGESLYSLHCAVCHGTAGRGDGPGARALGLRIPDFTDRSAMAQVSDGFLADIIRKGGSPFGRSGAMPAWGMKLSDAETSALVAAIRSFAGPAPSR